MTTKQTTATAVAALYTAAGRNYAEVELSLYHNVLADADDATVQEAVADIIRSVDLGRRPPSPALVLETVRGIIHRRELENQPLAIEAAPPSPEQRESIRAHIERARAGLGGRHD